MSLKIIDCIISSGLLKYGVDKLEIMLSKFSILIIYLPSIFFPILIINFGAISFVYILKSIIFFSNELDFNKTNEDEFSSAILNYN